MRNIFIVLFLLLIVPTVSALDAIPEWETSCFNSTHIKKLSNVTNPSTGASIYLAQEILKCPYDCNDGRDICNKWPGEALSGEYFLVFEILSIGILLLTVFRLDEKQSEIKIFDLFISIMGVSLFIILALQGNNVIDMSTGEAIPMVMIIWFNYGLSLVMLMLFFFNVFKFIRSAIEEGSTI